MTRSNLTDFHSNVKTPLQAHTYFYEKLLHLQEVLHFTLHIDLMTVSPKELHAQLLSLDQIVEDLVQRHETVQKDLPTAEEPVLQG